MHVMNAVVLAINAYQYYQNDVEVSFDEIETMAIQSRSHSHAQATDVSKLNNELAKMKKEFTTQTRTLAKESAASREQVSTLKSRLVQAERDLNDANTECAALSVAVAWCSVLLCGRFAEFALCIYSA
jgi:capsule polysaccharide export protein KpsE/RkpR